MSARFDDGYSTWERPFAPLDPMVTTVAEVWFEDLPCGWSDEAVTTMPVGLLVGEDPGPGGRAELPLWPWPARRSGGRLLAWSRMPTGEYLTRLARVNLARTHVARWEPHEAGTRLRSILDHLPHETRVVLCGARARDAYADDGFEWFNESNYVPPGGGRVLRVVAIPHPSPRTREYNDQATRDRTGAVLRWAARWNEEGK